MFLLKIVIAVLAIGGVMLMIRRRSGLVVASLLVPALILGAKGTFFLATAYLIFVSLIVCFGLLLYVVIRAMTR